MDRAGEPAQFRPLLKNGMQVVAVGNRATMPCNFVHHAGIVLTRGADLAVDEELDAGFLEAMQEMLLDRGEGRTVRLELTFLYPDIVPDADLELLGQRIREAYATMDVLIYDGHAGQDPSYSGVVYHYNPRKAIPANERAMP